MNNLAVKEVEFNGDTLLAAQENNSEKIYVGVKWVSEGIGLSDGQTKNERKKIQQDLVLSQGGRNLVLPTNSGEQEVLCIELEFLPLWLAKISITPKMKENNPKMVQKLVDYQLKAKEVLANAFVHGVTQVIPKTYKEALIELVESLEENEKLEKENLILKPKAITHDQLVSTENLSSMLVTSKNVGVGEKRLFEFLRATGVLFRKEKNSVPYQRYINSGYFEVKVSTWENKYGRIFSEHVTMVTGKGKPFINDLINKYGGAKIIDSLSLKEIQAYVENFDSNLVELQ